MCQLRELSTDTYVSEEQKQDYAKQYMDVYENPILVRRINSLRSNKKRKYTAIIGGHIKISKSSDAESS